MSSWQLLGSCPFMASWGSLHIGTNQGELIYVSRQHLNYATLESNPSLIHIYNTNNHQWRRYQNAPENIEHHTASIDPQTQMLYIKDASSNVFIINLKDQNFKSFKTNLSARITASCIINNRFNVFDGAQVLQHIVWENEYDQFIQNRTSTMKIPNDLNIQACNIMYIPWDHSLLLFSGISNDYKSCNNIHKYEINDAKWNKIPLKLPVPLRLCGHTSTRDNLYMFIFGGITNNNGNSKNIYILNTQTMQFKTSVIKFPFISNGCKAVIPNNKSRDELAVFGWIRSIWNNNNDEIKQNGLSEPKPSDEQTKDESDHESDSEEVDPEENEDENINNNDNKNSTSKLNPIPFMPHYMIQLLAEFYCDEYVHLIQTDEQQNNHWRIKVDTLLQFEEDHNHDNDYIIHHQCY